MILLTGHSDSMDGIAFLADTEDHATALKMLRDEWNKDFTDNQMKIVVTEHGDYLLDGGVSDEVIQGFNDEAPGREGFAIHAHADVMIGEVLERMAW